MNDLDRIMDAQVSIMRAIAFIAFRMSVTVPGADKLAADLIDEATQLNMYAHRNDNANP